MSTRIYPVPVKPASQITTWESWPEDVRRTLWALNHAGYRLSFVRSSGVFKCLDCGEFCFAHSCGAAVLHDGWNDRHAGDWLCDDCLIARARALPWLEGVKLIKAYDYWDGPLSGIAEHEGTQRAFALHGSEVARRRIYALYGEPVDVILARRERTGRLASAVGELTPTGIFAFQPIAFPDWMATR